MLKSILDKQPPAPKTLEEAQAIIGVLMKLVRDLAVRVEELEDQLARDSGNSSQPPSQDGPKQRAERKRKKPTGRKKGAQPGQKKHQRELLPQDQVDKVERFYPAARCGCGG